MASIGELFVSLGFKIDDGGLKKFDKEVRDFKKNLILIPALAAAAVVAIDRFTASSVNAAVALSNFNAQTGLMSNKLREFQVAGQLSDISLTADQVTASIQNLQRNITAISFGGGDIGGFSLLGIGNVLGKDAFQVLKEIRANINNIDPAKATSLLERIGLDAKFINVLKLSNEEFEKLGKQYLLSSEANADLIRLGTAFTDLGMVLKNVKDRFVAFLSPVLIQGVRIIKNVTQGIAALGESFVKVSEHNRVFAGLLGVLAAGFVALRIAARPFLLIAGLLLLWVEDFLVAMSGGESVIGSFVKMIGQLAFIMTQRFNQMGAIIRENLTEPLEKVEKFFKRFSLASFRNFTGGLKDRFFGGGGGQDFNQMAAGIVAPLTAGGGAFTQTNIFTIHASNLQEAEAMTKRLISTTTQAANTLTNTHIDTGARN